MPEMLNSHAAPSGRRKIVACRGMRSPTFQPNRFAVSVPTIAPDRSASHAFFWSAGSTNSGYISSQLSLSTAMLANWFFVSW